MTFFTDQDPPLRFSPSAASKGTRRACNVIAVALVAIVAWARWG